MEKFKILYRVLKAYFYKLAVDLCIIKPRKLVKNDVPEVVVSLTSYGRRISANVVYYTLVSLLRQSHLPDRLVLWLDKDNWNDSKIPKKIKDLNEYGLEIKYCEDIKSYKKLIPSLKEFDNSVIITVDDDVIYNKDIIQSLLKEKCNRPNTIISHHARFPKAYKDKFEPYNAWPLKRPKNGLTEFIMPIGVSGVLYPPGSFDKEVFNEEIFNSLCPFADDIWFWLMAKRNGMQHHVIDPGKSIGNSFDDLYQFFNKGSALTHTNSKENANDVQLHALMNYYKISVDSLKNE